jgi:hypothetical protein
MQAKMSVPHQIEALVQVIKAGTELPAALGMRLT